MSFLGGLFLIALPLIAIPVVIHMMKKRQRDVIPWGAMQFLRQPTRRGQRMSDLDRWLLLAARMLILACLIGALSQPLLRWGQSMSADGLPTQIVMIDDTRSTLAVDKFESIRAAADELIASIPSGTPVEVWASGSPPRRIAGNAASATDGTTNNEVRTSTNQQMRSAVASYSPRGGDGNFVASVRQAVAAVTLKDGQNTDRVASTKASANSPLDVWLLSDDTTAGWNPPLSPSTMIPGQNHRLHLMQISADLQSSYQLAVAAVSSSRRAIAKNESVELSASVVNHGPNPSSDVMGFWKHNGKVFAETNVESLQPDSQTTVKTELSIESPGTHGISFELSSDAMATAADSLPADDLGYVVVQVIGELPLLVITDSQQQIGNMPADEDYLAAALGRNLGGWKSVIDDQQSEEDSASQSLFRPEVFDISELSEVSWRRYPVIVWLGATELPPNILQKIVGRVRQGAGLWITLDSLTDRDAINEALGSRGLGIGNDGNRSAESSSKSGGLVGRLVVNGSPEQMQRLHPPDPTDAVLSPLADTERLDLGAVRIRRRIELSLPRDETTSRVMLRTFEGDPIALLSSVGRGRVVLQALPMNPTWSNFPLSKSFVVWVLQVLDHLSQPVSQNYNLVAGQMLRQDVDSIDHQFELTLPGGETETLIALPQMGSRLGWSDKEDANRSEAQYSGQVSGIVRFDQTQRPGLYQLTNLDDDRAPSIKFSVVVDPNESDVSTNSTELLTELAVDQRVNLHHSADGFDFPTLLAAIPKDDSLRTGGKPLWPALLLGLIAAIAIETFLAGYAALRRYGRLAASDDSAPSAPTLNPARSPTQSAVFTEPSA